MRGKWLGAAIAAAVALALMGCGNSETSGKPGSNLSKSEKYGIAEEIIEEEGFSHGAAKSARDTAEANGLNPAEAAEMGAIAKQMGK